MRLERIRSRVSASGACSRMTSSKVCLESSIIAQSSPPVELDPGLGEERRVDLALGVAEFRQAQRVGQPLRGVDRQHGDALARARPSRRRSRQRSSSCRRRPSPAQTQMLLPVQHFAMPAISPRRRSASAPTCSSPISGSNRNGSSVTGASHSLRSRASCSRWSAARRCSVSAARHAARRGLAGGAVLRRSGRLAVVEALRIDAVADDPVDLDPDVGRRGRAPARRLVDRHLLGQGDHRDAGSLRVADELRRASRPAGGSGRPWRPRRTSAASAGSRRRDRWRGVDDDQVVVVAAAGLAVSSASSQILPIVTSSLNPGVAAAR